MDQDAIPPVSLKDYDADFGDFSRRLGRTFERFGFAVISDHALPDALVQGALERTKAFFALPETVKRGYIIPGGAGQRGYTAFGVEAAKGAEHGDLKEFWHVGRDLPSGHPYSGLIAPNVWPDEIAGFPEAAISLYEGLEAMGLRLLRAIAHYLGLQDDALTAAAKDADSILRLLHYPPLADGAEGSRAGPHEDINAITLLLGAEEAGLQVLARDGRWLAINPPPGSVVVNIGDMLQRLTNDRLPSTTHRVVNPALSRRGAPRFSTPFFLHFAPDYPIRTLRSCVRADRPDRYPKPITAHDYLMERLREIKLA
ncbi:MAG TPA: 2-oxoglutarate and iron-dependent oxygenase domain-containing protein [Caulobacteraceae bacterium]|nr:2-oxoglutarate and iron-dependent oxygenase domain-containing protein [Caulobacteraceae bacterium]